MLASDKHPVKKGSITLKTAVIIVRKIETMVKENPNDQELGQAVRALLKDEMPIDKLVAIEEGAKEN